MIELARIDAGPQGWYRHIHLQNRFDVGPADDHAVASLHSDHIASLN